MNFSDELINWYHIHKRDLPWRHTNDAYLIWLSEIILQQTRVEQGMPYYFRFAERFPDVKSFAASDEDEILKLWQGLGYYSRGRNMLKTARKVVEEFNGVFPSAYADLIKLTGVGEYTAAAISSFSVNEPKAVVDGNVYRLLSRYFGIDIPINTTEGKRYFQKVADELLNAENAGVHNQAMIEFGALQCKPRNPDCLNCPFYSSCYARLHNRVAELPVKLKKLKIKERYFYYFIVIENNRMLIKRRDNRDIWAGLYDFPLVESLVELSLNDIFENTSAEHWFSADKAIYSVSEPVKHILTHQRIFGTFIEISGVKESVIKDENWFWVDLSKLQNYAQPKLIFAFLKNFHKLNEI